MENHKSVFITLTPDKVIAILDELVQKGAYIGNIDELLESALKKHGTSVDDVNTYVEENEEEDIYTDSYFCRSLLACFIGAALTAREESLNQPVNIASAIAWHSSGHYYEESVYMHVMSKRQGREILDNPFGKAWEKYRNEHLYPEGPHQKLRGNHGLGVYEYCEMDDYDYMVRFATGGEWWDFDGFDWMPGIYEDYEKNKTTDAAVEKVCRILPLLYISPESVALLHSTPASAEAIWKDVLSKRAPTMPKTGRFSRNVFLEFAKKKRLVCIFLGVLGGHKIYAGQEASAHVYYMTLGGLGFLYIRDLFAFGHKFKAYGNKRDYYKPLEKYEYVDV